MDNFSAVKLIPSKGSVREFTIEDLKVANSLQPVSVVKHLNHNSNYSFVRQIVDFNDIEAQEHSLSNNGGATMSSQFARGGPNPITKRIGNSMDVDGINLSTITITLNTNGNGGYDIVDGFGRFRTLRARKYTNVLAFVPDKKLKEEVYQQLSQQANDHQPQAPISRADIVDGVSKALPEGRIPGITRDLFIRYSTSTATLEEESAYIIAIQKYIKVVGKNNHHKKAIKSMVSDISRDSKTATSDIQLFIDNNSLVEWLSMLDEILDRKITPNSKVNVILPLVNDGTRKPENVLGAIVKKYTDTLTQSRAQATELNMGDSFAEPESVSVVIGMSKWNPQTVFTKMAAIKTVYRMKDTFNNFLRNIELMVKKDNVFIESNEIPKIGFKGFINPWKTLEKYGWVFKDLITWGSHPSFNDVVVGLCKDGLLTQDEVDKLKIN